MPDEMQPHVPAIAHSVEDLAEPLDIAAGMSATPDSKWIGGTMSVSLTVSSSSPTTCWVSSRSPGLGFELSRIARPGSERLIVVEVAFDRLADSLVDDVSGVDQRARDEPT
jgi:hypothetical protein